MKTYQAIAAAITASICLLGSTLAVAFVGPFAELELGDHLGLLYHYKKINPLALILAILACYLCRRMSVTMRVLVGIFAGGAAANFASSYIWEGVPDYIIVWRYDTVMNLADVAVMGSVAGIIALAVLRLLHRFTRRVRLAR